VRNHKDVAGAWNFSAIEGMRRVCEKHGEILVTRAVADTRSFGFRPTDFPDHAADTPARGRLRVQRRQPFANLFTMIFEARERDHAGSPLH